ncbi:MAG: family 1 encapsulin nanocompartment shell protein [Eubacterium sp.]
MDYLARTTAPFGDEIWEQIDHTVIETAKKYLVGRRFLEIYGPLGAGTQAVSVDSTEKDETIEDGFATITGRKLIELPQLYEDFVLLWRDLETAEKLGIPLDLSAGARAAQASAKAEDYLIFHGNKTLGHKGLLNADGATVLKKDDWSTGENAFSNIASGAALFDEKGILGRYSLIIGPDLYYQLQRIQPGTGMMEIDRIKSLLDGRVFKSTTVIGKALLVCSESQYMDLAIGQDLATSYLELTNLNHYFRILETIALRIKNSDAIIVYE